MIHGYPMVKNLCGGLQRFMAKHGFTSVAQFRGASLPYFTTHTDLVARQRAAVAAKKSKVWLCLGCGDSWWGARRFCALLESCHFLVWFSC